MKINGDKAFDNKVSARLLSEGLRADVSRRIVDATGKRRTVDKTQTNGVKSLRFGGLSQIVFLSVGAANRSRGEKRKCVVGKRLSLKSFGFLRLGGVVA